VRSSANAMDECIERMTKKSGSVPQNPLILSVTGPEPDHVSTGSVDPDPRGQISCLT
jgi:hypothetical protein